EDHADGHGQDEELDEARDLPGEEEEQCDDGHDDEEERGEEGAQELGEPFGVDAGGWGGGRHLDEVEQYGLEDHFLSSRGVPISGTRLSDDTTGATDVVDVPFVALLL